MIQGHGNPSPKAIFIADAAYGEDLRSNYALSGYQGNTLAGFCKSQHYHIDDFYRTCLLKQEPPGKEHQDDAANKELLPQYGPILLEEIQSLHSNLLIPLGELSFQYLTGLTGIRKFRGSVLPTRGDLFPSGGQKKVLPILGPFPFLNQDYKLRVISQLDFGKIPRNIHDGPIPDNFYNIWVARTSDSLRNFMERAYPLAISNGYPLVFDIETYLQIPTCISFCFDGFESVCVPLFDISIDTAIRVVMLDLVAKLLASPIPKVNQNIKYDWKILNRWGFTVNNVIGDTMLAASTLYCEFPKNLGFLTSIYTDIPYFKDEGRQFDPSKHKKDQYYLYNAKDSLATHQIHTKQLEEIKEQGVGYVYKSLVRLMPHYKRMENRGILICQETRQRLLAKYESLFETEEYKLGKLLGSANTNSLSSLQCRRIVYDVLGYKPIRGVGKTKKGEPKTDEDSLTILLIGGKAERAPSTGPPILQVILNCRKLHKVIEILELPLYPDGRFRCEFNLAGTETGRSSAGETTDQLIYLDDKKVAITNLGHSLQTIGKHGFSIDGVTYGQDLRSMYVPTPGYRFVECDLSGAEARVDRVLSGVFDMDVFDNPGIHRLTGSWCYDCSPSEIKKGTLVNGIDRYHVAKQVRHSGERNITANGLNTKFLPELSLKECDRLLLKFHKFQPEIREVYHHDIIKCIDEEHRLIMPNGRRRDFFDRIDNHTYNEAISTPPQAIVSDQTKFQGVLHTFEEVDWAYLLTEQHDGVLVEVPIGREEEFASIYKKNVETPIDFRQGSLKRDYELTIPCEISIGSDWYNMKELK